MAHKVMLRPYEMVSTPPVGWRKPMPLSVKLQVIINQRGLAPDNTPLDAIGVGIQFDHRPPLHEREYDALGDETNPQANDVRFIVALPAPLHREISRSDVRRMRKTDRQRMAEVAFRETLKRKQPGQPRVPKGIIRSRSFGEKDK